MSTGKVTCVLFLVSVVSAVYGFAASFNMSVGGLAAFAMDGKGCQQASLDTTLQFHVDGEGNPTTVDEVVVSNINAACEGQGLKVAVADASGTLLAERNVGVLGSSTQSVDFSSDNVAAADASAAHAIIPKSS